ncbi:MAG: putative baseplate assembly protein, partial [Actinomycetales bacterium]
MTLPAPNLDDRGFQDLVDEAKRLVQLRNPNWTDHNVSDPGVTLIETFAYMVDQLIYRLNRVPDLHYVKFLDLLGERMIPPAAATANIEFWLSVAADVAMDIPMGTQVSTARLGADLPVTFSTMEDLRIPALACTSLLTRTIDGTFESPAEMIAVHKEFPTFSEVPKVGDCLYIGLNEPASHCFVRLTVHQIDTDEGIGVDPNNPPYVVQAWDGDQWSNARIVRDDTGGLNRENSMDVFVAKHAESTIAGESAAWLRIAIVETVGRQPAYVRTPVIKDVSAEAVGGVSLASHSEIVENDLVGP